MGLAPPLALKMQVIIGFSGRSLRDQLPRLLVFVRPSNVTPSAIMLRVTHFRGLNDLLIRTARSPDGWADQTRIEDMQETGHIPGGITLLYLVSYFLSRRNLL